MKCEIFEKLYMTFFRNLFLWNRFFEAMYFLEEIDSLI